MRTGITRLLAFIPLLLLALTSGRAGETNAIGRYQLFSGPSVIKDGAGVVRASTALYRIDTVTGQTWRYDRDLICGPKEPGGVFAEAWVMLAEDHITSSYFATAIAHGDQKANATFTRLSSTNAFQEAVDRMYWSPKRLEDYISTNHLAGVGQGVGAKSQKK
jgi:hypothetical protein